jgi:hypothetical protein
MSQSKPINSFLVEMATPSDIETRKALVRNPNTDLTLLFELGAEFPAELLANPAFSLPLLLLEEPELHKIVPSATMASLLQQNNLPTEFLKWAATHYAVWRSEVGTLIVQHPRSNQQILELVVAGLTAHNRSQELGTAILQHSAISEELMFRLAKQSMNAQVLIAIAQHPLRSQRILQVLGEQGEKIIFRPLAEYLVSQLDTPDFILDKLARQIAHYVVLHPNTSPHTLTNLVLQSSRFHQAEMRLLAISHPDFPASTLQELVLEPKQYFLSHEMRVAIAQHPNTPLSALEQLVSNESNEPPNKHALVLEAVASRSNLSTALIVKLAQSAGQKALVKNQRIPSEILAQLANHPEISVKKLVAKHPNTPIAILESWVNHPTLAQAILENPQTPAWIFEQLMEVEATHPILAKNPATPSHILQSLALQSLDTNNSNMLRLVAEHPNTPRDTLMLLAQKEAERVARHPNTPVELLRQWMRNERLLRPYIAENPNAPTDLLSQLKQLADHYNSPINAALAQNPRSPDRLLEQLIEHHGCTIAQRSNLSNQLFRKLFNSSRDEYRQQLAANPHTPIQYLQQLATSTHQGVQKMIIENPSTPIALLKELMSHPDLLIRDTALRKFLLRSTIAKFQHHHP